MMYQKNIPNIYFIQVFILILISSCDKKEEPASLPDLRIYLDRFAQEAKQRGYDLDLSKVEAVYSDEVLYNGEDRCGLGYMNYNGTGIRRIVISTASGCWDSFNETEKEILVFHELGHAFMARPHDDNKLCDGSPVSVMSGISGGPFSTYTFDEPDKRSYYITELIDKLAANEQCIKKTKDWKTDPLFYKLTVQDDNWHFFPEKDSYEGTRDSENLYTITSHPGSNEMGESFWVREFLTPNIPDCADVEAKITLKGNNIEGAGVYVALEAFQTPLKKDGATHEIISITNNEVPLMGSFDNHEEDLVLPCFTRENISLVIKLSMLPGTTGTVSVKDIEIFIREK